MKKTIKLVFAVILLFTAIQNANAQFSKKGDSREPDRFHMGIRGGFTVNTYTGGGYESVIFPTGGLALDFKVAPFPLFVGVGVNYVNYGTKAEYYNYSRYGSYTSKKTIDGHSIQVPITVSYHINVAPKLFINPFIGEFSAYNFNNDFKEQFNYGLRFGCGMNYGRLTFEAGYDLGLANLAKSGTARTSTFFMNIGFNWAGSK